VRTPDLTLGPAPNLFLLVILFILLLLILLLLFPKGPPCRLPTSNLKRRPEIRSIPSVVSVQPVVSNLVFHSQDLRHQARLRTA
jgi:hypothetical protein